MQERSGLEDQNHKLTMALRVAADAADRARSADEKDDILQRKVLAQRMLNAAAVSTPSHSSMVDAMKQETEALLQYQTVLRERNRSLEERVQELLLQLKEAREQRDAYKRALEQLEDATSANVSRTLNSMNSGPKARISPSSRAGWANSPHAPVVGDLVSQRSSLLMTPLQQQAHLPSSSQTLNRLPSEHALNTASAADTLNRLSVGVPASAAKLQRPVDHADTLQRDQAIAYERSRTVDPRNDSRTRSRVSLPSPDLISASRLPSSSASMESTNARMDAPQARPAPGLSTGLETRARLLTPADGNAAHQVHPPRPETLSSRLRHEATTAANLHVNSESVSFPIRLPLRNGYTMAQPLR